MSSLRNLRFVEQYDPNDLVSKEQPYAYVCDQVHDVHLSVDVDDVRGKGVTSEAWDALADLRDKIAPGEKVGWFVVVNGDVERWAPPLEDEEGEEDGIEKGWGSVAGSGDADVDASLKSPVSQKGSVTRMEEEEDSAQISKEPKGLKKLFNKARRAKR
jgi:hypothetical protein